MKKNESPLAGLTVIELASVLAGPSIGMFLAELGAMVIKVENPLTCGDVTRSWKLSSEPEESDISAYFACVNWGKRSVAINLKDEEGLQLVHDLVAASDIILASYRPGAAERLQVDYRTLRGLNPRIIYAHITGYGLENPRGGYDALAQAESGFMYMNGEPDSPPTKMPVSLIDLLAAHQAKEGILLALLARERTGEGEYISVSLLQAGAASLTNQATNWLIGGKIPQRMGSDHPNIVPYGTMFTTRDNRQIVLAVGNDKQFKDLCAVLGVPQMATDPAFVANHARVRGRTPLCKRLQELISKWGKDELLSTLLAAGVPAGAVNNMKEVCEQPEVAAMLVEGVTSMGERVRAIGSVAFDFVGASLRSELSPPPHYGEDTRAVLKQQLQRSDREIEALLAKGAIDLRTEG